MNMCIKLDSIAGGNIKYVLKQHPVHDFEKFYKKIPESFNSILLKKMAGLTFY